MLKNHFNYNVPTTANNQQSNKMFKFLFPVRHHRTHTGFKPLKCKYCYRPFGDPSNLNKHVRLHAEGDTPYKYVVHENHEKNSKNIRYY